MKEERGNAGGRKGGFRERITGGMMIDRGEVMKSRKKDKKNGEEGGRNGEYKNRKRRKE